MANLAGGEGEPEGKGGSRYSRKSKRKPELTGFQTSRFRCPTAADFRSEVSLRGKGREGPGGGEVEEEGESRGQARPRSDQRDARTPHMGLPTDRSDGPGEGPPTGLV